MDSEPVLESRVSNVVASVYGVNLKTKLERLVDEIHTQIRRIKAGDNRELLEVEYLFYPQDLRAGLHG